MEREAEELREKLKEQAGKCLDVATSLRTEDPKRSYFFFTIAELCSAAAEKLDREIPKESEMEGGGSTWWYVCPECNGAIDKQDRFCRHCGQAVK